MKSNIYTQNNGAQQQQQQALAPYRVTSTSIAPQRQAPPVLRTSRTEVADQQNQQLATNGEPQKQSPVKAEVKVGRNDPCPCGSGKKFKNCHGQAVGV